MADTPRFPDELDYFLPAHGSWNLTHMAFLMPESHLLFACPAGCTRVVSLAAAELGASHRFSSLFVPEDVILLGGMEEFLLNGASALLDSLTPLPKVLFLFVSCIDDFLGTDPQQFLVPLREKYPAVTFLLGHMNPIKRQSSLPPVVNMQKQLVAPLVPTGRQQNAVNLIGSNRPLHQGNELYEILGQNGFALRHISQCRTLADYQTMAESRLDLVISPMGRAAAEDLRGRVSIPYQFHPLTFDHGEIDAAITSICQALGIPVPDLAPYRAACIEKVQKTAEALKGIPIVLDGGASLRPFSLARFLIENGFSVKSLYADACPPFEAAALSWLDDHAPNLELLPLEGDAAPRMRRELPHAIAIGQRSAYQNSTGHLVNLIADNGLWGYGGIMTLCDMLLTAKDEVVDLKQALYHSGMGCVL